MPEVCGMNTGTWGQPHAIEFGDKQKKKAVILEERLLPAYQLISWSKGENTGQLFRF